MHKEIILARHGFLQAIRHFFLEREFIEVETPILVPGIGTEPHIEPFRTLFTDGRGPPHNRELYLITSPEFSLKKAIASGLPRVFQVTKVFRNGEDQGVSVLHNPEFTMLEWYRAAATDVEIMNDMEVLIAHVGVALVKQGLPLNRNLSWDPPFERFSIPRLFGDFAAMELTPLTDAESLRAQGAAQKISLPAKHPSPEVDYENLYWQIFLDLVEPNLPKNRPFFLIDYPPPLASFAKINARSGFAQRFELYLGSVETANGFVEITDAAEQSDRFSYDNRLRVALNKPVIQYDTHYLRVLEQGMPETTGVAIGLDRLLMALLGYSSIADVLPYAAN